MGFEKTARLSDEVRRLEAVDLVVSDDPLARQSAVETVAEKVTAGAGQSKSGRAGHEGGNAKREKR